VPTKTLKVLTVLCIGTEVLWLVGCFFTVMCMRTMFGEWYVSVFWHSRM